MFRNRRDEKSTDVKNSTRAHARADRTAAVLYTCYRFFSIVGLLAAHAAKSAARFCVRAGRASACALRVFFGTLVRPLRRQISRLPVRHAAEKIKDEGLHDALSRALRRLREDRRSLKRALCYIIPCTAFAVLLVAVSVWTGATYALKVRVGGRDIGCVSSESVFDEAVTLFNSRIVEPAAEPAVAEEAPQFSLQMATTSTLSTPEDVYASLVEAENAYRQICGVYVDGRLRAYAENEASAQAELGGILAEYETAPDESAAFYRDVELREGLYAREALQDVQPLEEVASASEDAYIAYSAQQGDSLRSIAEQFGASQALLEAVNTSANLKAGETVHVVAPLPLFSVKIVRRVVSEEPVAYSVIQEENDELEKDVTAVVQEGAAGLQRITTEAVFLNGTLIGVQEENQTMAEPTPAKVLIGTKEEPETETQVSLPVPEIELVGSDGFCWPLDKSSYHYVSAYYGDGRGHRGIDIAAYEGTSILAAANGTVVGVNNMGSSYGLHFVVDHGNGVQTLYAHCSELYVSLGQEVAQGEVVAAVGSTGRSTGPHLHFEIQVHGEQVNPAPYLGL